MAIPHYTCVYVDDGWKVLELCVAWQSLKDPIAFLPCGEAQCIVVLSSGEEDPSVFGEVIQNSGFQDSDAMLLDDEPCVDAPAGASEPQEFAPAPPEPVADQMEHVPASVQTDSNAPVVVDGIGLSMGSTLGALKAACLKLNLSQSGSKRRCLDRFRGYVQKQQLMAECEIAEAAKEVSERPPRAQFVPEVPSKEEPPTRSLISRISLGVRIAP